MGMYSPRRLPRRLQKPRRLEKGDSIILLAPGSPPLQPDVVDLAAAALTERGYDVRIARHARDRHGFIAGKDRPRLGDLNHSLRTKSARALVSIRGGYGCGRIISGVRFDAVKDRPKILLGCSDITALHCGMVLEGGTISFHGPMPQSLVEPDCPPFTWERLIGMISGHDSSLGSIADGYPNAAETVMGLRRGRTTGRLIGGNLAVMASLVGTRFFPSLDKSIFFFEDIGETPFRVDRYLTQLLNAGILQSAAGFALGLFKDCEYRPPKPGDPVEYRQNLRDVIVDRLIPLGKPVVMGLPFGHLPYNATIPVGGLATLDGTRGMLAIEELAVE